MQCQERSVVARPWYGTDNGHGVPCPYDTKFKSPTLKNEGWGTPRAVIRHCHADEREGGRYETNCHADEREGGARRDDLLRGARQTLCRCGCGANAAPVGVRGRKRTATKWCTGTSNVLE